MRVLATTAFVFLAPLQALAQGTGAPAAPDWSGFSAGLQAGGAWGSSSWTDHFAGDIGSHVASGALGGLQAGYDRQTGAWVWGARADASWSGLAGSHQDAVFGYGPVPQYDREKVDFTGTIPARLGHAWGPALVSVRAGAAWAHARYSLEGYYVAGQEFTAASTIRWGWTAGLGIEYGFAGPWVASFEYDYLGMGSHRADLSCTTSQACRDVGTDPISIDVRENFHVLKAVVAYRF